MRKYAAIVFFMLLSAGARAEVDARVILSPPVVPFHQQATLTLIVESPAGLELDMPDLRSLLGDLKVDGTPEHKRELVGEDRVRLTEVYTLDPIHVRDHFLPPLEITWGDGERLAVPMPAFRVRELTPEELAEAEQFQSALPGGPGTDTGPRWPAWAWAVAIAAAAVLVAVAILIARRVRGKIPAAAPVVMPWERARERLALLAKRQLPQQGKYDAYYVDLSAILRYYIEGRFQLHAPEQTTPEFLNESLGKGHFTPEQEVFLARFLRLCDRVKFARFRPDLEEMQRSFEEVERFIEETVPREEPQPPEQERAAA